MFDFIRTHQRLMQLVLLVLILPSFVLIGVSGYTTYVSGDNELVKVGDSAITAQEYDQARRAQLDQFQRQMGTAFDPALLENEPTRRALLESLIDRRVIIDVATNERFSASDAALRNVIANTPDFQEDGKFSAGRYNELLAMSGLDSKMYEQGRRSELALDRVLGPVRATGTVPAPVASLLRQALVAERTLRLASFDAADYREGIQVSDEDIAAWYEEHKSEFALPEQVSIQYLLLNEEAAMKNLPAISEAELKKYYEQNKARYVQPPRVDVSHILISVPAGANGEAREAARKSAQEIADRVAADPASFADVAREASQDAGTARNGGKLGWISHGMWPEAIEKAVFALEKGKVSGVVEGPEGFHVFKADDVQAEQGESFEQARAKVESEVRRQLGAEQFSDMASKLTGLVYDNPESLEPAASALGLEIRAADGVARDRLLSEDEAGKNAASAGQHAAILEDVRVRRALFSSAVLADKQNSGVIEISPDTMVVVRVADRKPEHIPELAAVKDRIASRLVDERAAEAARKAGEAALEKYKAASADVLPEGFSEPRKVSRLQSQGLSKPLFDAVFAAGTDALPAYVGVGDETGYIIARVEQASDGSSVDQGLLAGLNEEIGSAWGQLEEQAVLRALREQAKVKILPEAENAIKGEDQNS